jgi:hypothetical protein
MASAVPASWRRADRRPNPPAPARCTRKGASRRKGRRGATVSGAWAQRSSCDPIDPGCHGTTEPQALKHRRQGLQRRGDCLDRRFQRSRVAGCALTRCLFRAAPGCYRTPRALNHRRQRLQGRGGRGIGARPARLARTISAAAQNRYRRKAAPVPRATRAVGCRASNYTSTP